MMNVSEFGRGFAVACLVAASAYACSSSSQPSSGGSAPQGDDASGSGGSSSGGSLGSSSGSSSGGSSGSTSGGSSGSSSGSSGASSGDDAADDAVGSDAPAADTGANQPDAGACAPCPAMYNCVAAPSGLQVSYADTQDPDGTCHVSGLQLYCGGTGTAANGSPITWAAGSNLGPSGGPGIVIQATSLQLNCE